eukprot:scaffold12431_cov94-Cyclotella_meneghiniana.AAC.12
MNNSEISYQSPSDSSEMDPSITINVGDNNESNSVLSSNYDNSKRVRRDSSFASLVSEQAHQTLIRARTPAEIVSYVYNDMSWSILRGFGISILTFFVGVHGPKAWVLPLMGGLTWRPIPYQITNNGDVLLDLGLANELIPKSDVTFPSARLYFLSLWAPLTIVAIIGVVLPLAVSAIPNNNPLHNLHAGVCTLLTAIGVSEFVTQVFKFYVGRLRPNFYAMCGFDKATLQCTNGEEMEMEARMSFPSGLGRVGTQYPLIKYKFGVLFSFLPLLFSFWCATSRLVDNWHHPSDIIAGSIIGSISGLIAYHLWYPHVLSSLAGVPLSIIEQSQEEKSKTGSDYIIVEKQISLPVRS